MFGVLLEVRQGSLDLLLELGGDRLRVEYVEQARRSGVGGLAGGLGSLGSWGVEVELQADDMGVGPDRTQNLSNVRVRVHGDEIVVLVAPLESAHGGGVELEEISNEIPELGDAETIGGKADGTAAQVVAACALALEGD